MANFTASECVKNSGATLSMLAAQASQTIDMGDRPDERVVIVVENTNDAVLVETATITIAPGDFLANVMGTASIDVADNGAFKVLGPFESVRFKNSASQIAIGVSVTQSGTVSSVNLGVIKLP